MVSIPFLRYSEGTSNVHLFWHHQYLHHIWSWGKHDRKHQYLSDKLSNLSSLHQECLLELPNEDTFKWRKEKINYNTRAWLTNVQVTTAFAIFFTTQFLLPAFSIWLNSSNNKLKAFHYNSYNIPLGKCNPIFVFFFFLLWKYKQSPSDNQLKLESRNIECTSQATLNGNNNLNFISTAIASYLLPASPKVNKTNKKEP